MVIAALAGAGATASTAFVYNRQNFLFDNMMRYDRYCLGRGFASAQAGMYREDIRDMTAATVNKADRYHYVGMVLLVCTFQLCLAGRLGLHGPSPPGWLMGPYMASLCGAWLFIIMSVWLAMHASARATSGMVHMLTRSVRLPIPTPHQLDMARNFGNKFEQQRVHDMFRVPFITPHVQEQVPEDRDLSQINPTIVDEEEDRGPRKRGSKFKKSNYPAWVQDEKTATMTSTGGTQGPEGISSEDEMPDHFELYRRLQYEWWSHDVYSRISIVIGLQMWSHATAYYSSGHGFAELRDMWSPYAVSIMMAALFTCLYLIDFQPKSSSALGFVEYIAPLPGPIACLGMSLEYRYEYSATAASTAVFLGLLINAIHILWVLRLFELCSPDAPPPTDDMTDAPSVAFWPPQWKLPSAFVQTVYQVAPPYELMDGQRCLQKEMDARAGVVGKGAPATKSTQDVKDAVEGRLRPVQVWPWRIVRSGLAIQLALWLFLVCARIIDTIYGERNLLRRPTKPRLINGWTRNHTRGEWWHAGGFNRRLAEADGSLRQEPAVNHGEVAAAVDQLMPMLKTLADSARSANASSAVNGVPIVMDWPGKQEPTILTCGPQGALAAFAPAGSGTILKGQQFDKVTLDGLSGLGDLMGASWSTSGLLVVSTTGALAECRGLPVNGRWQCQQQGPPLPLTPPLRGGSLASAAAVRTSDMIRAAVVFAEEPSVLLYNLTSDEEPEWLPAGEARLPPTSGRAASMTADELLVGTQDGTVLAWRFEKFAPEMIVGSAHRPADGSDLIWQGVCRHQEGVARLALRQPSLANGASSGWQPEVLITAANNRSASM